MSEAIRALYIAGTRLLGPSEKKQLAIVCKSEHDAARASMQVATLKSQGSLDMLSDKLLKS